MGEKIVGFLDIVVLILPRVSAPTNASTPTRDAKCLGAGAERPSRLSRPFSSSSDVERFAWVLI